MRAGRLNVGLFGLVLALLAVSLLKGPAALSSWQSLPALDSTILWQLRLPRALLALMAGAVLGLAGAVLQGLLRNPLAEPGVLGVSSSASLVVVALLYTGMAGVTSVWLALAGVAGALANLALLYLLNRHHSNITLLILAGAAINSMAGALIALVLNLSPDPFAASDTLFWLMGSVADRSLSQVMFILPFALVGTLLLALTGRDLDALSLGDKTALSLGVNLNRLRALAIGGSALVVGATVSVTGVIGFVGLMVPHLLRPWVQHRPSRLLLPSALAGASLLLAADIALRFLPPGKHLQIGVLTALIGAPFFLYLVVKLRREAPP